jgi:hypothetical protein
MRPIFLAACLVAFGAAGAGHAAPAPVALPLVGQESGYDRKLSINFRDVTLREALAQAFEGSHLQYVVEPNVPDVPINLNVRDVSLGALVRLLVRQAALAAPGITNARDGNITVVLMRSRFAPPAIASLPRDAAQKRVTVAFRDVPLREAVEGLFRGTGAQYRLEESVPNLRMSLLLRDVPLAQAFRLFLLQAASLEPGITSVRSGEVVVLRVTPPRPLGPAPAGSREPGEGAAAPAEMPWQRIPLQYADVVAVTRAFGGTLITEGGAPAPGPAPEELNLDEGAIRIRPLPPRGKGVGTNPDGIPPPVDPRILNPRMTGPATLSVPAGVERVVGVRSQNALLVRGTEQGVQALREMVRLLDVAPRQFRLRLTAGSLTGEGQVVNGSTLSVTDVRGGERLAASLTPRASGDGRVEVEVEGILRLGGTERPLQSRVRVKPGAATPFVILGEGSRARRVWLRVTEVPTSSAR